MSLRAPFSQSTRVSVEHAAQVAAPSGQALDLFEVLIDEVASEAWLRFRFLAPQIGRSAGTITFAQAAADFEHLCTVVALPYMREFDLEADVVVISLLDREVTFGQSDPEATQFIEAFRVTGQSCIWEGL